KYPASEQVQGMREALEEKYDVPVLALDVLNLTEEDVDNILASVLFEFPLTEIYIDVPKWVQSLEDDHWLVKHILDSIKASTDDISRVRDVDKISGVFAESEYVDKPNVEKINL